MKTTTPVATLACPADRVNREFQAPRPNALWRADITYVAPWAGVVYVAFDTDLTLDALEQALYARVLHPHEALVHQRDRGSQYLSIRYTERLAEAIIGLDKTEVIRPRGPWRGLEAVEFATLEWVD